MELNEEEKRIVKCSIKGLTNIEIAQELEYCESTVKKRLTRIYKKIGINGRIDLMKKALDGTLVKYFPVHDKI